MLKTLMLGLMFVATQMQAVIDISGKGVNKQALFFGACKQGNVELVKQLINAGVDVNALDSVKETALCNAIKKNNIAIVKLLIAAGCDVNKKYESHNLQKMTPLHHAVQGRIEIANLLIMAGANVNAKGYTDDRPVLLASLPYPGIPELLIKYGADTNVKLSWGETVISCIVKHESYSANLLKLFIDNGNTQLTEADLNYAMENDLEKFVLIQNYLQAKEAKKSSITIYNNTDTNLLLTHTTDVPAQSKAVITTEISKI
jgi:ankyrin repeat protein